MDTSGEKRSMISNHDIALQAAKVLELVDKMDLTATESIAILKAAAAIVENAVQSEALGVAMVKALSNLDN